ncbi:MAG TPA: PD-(D/E)XK nuclease family protein [Candidatus Baltobacteraceae bacterium]|nr:PD-(D/E)XK nuclease family protein [Candidatus Baltobacteraceae bacterium]
MQARFVLGPAGTGKTFLCLAEIREALRTGASGPPLILLAPRQATFQLERQLLADPELQGYTRLQILSFERLAAFVLEQSGGPIPPLLSEDGRSMVLHALLGRRRKDLEIFHASAGLAGFARQLSVELRELQRRRLSPDSLRALSARPDLGEALRRKLRDLSLLLTDYLEWLREHELQDADCLLDLAADALKRSDTPLLAGNLWLDGFAEMTPQELDLLAAMAPRCKELTLAFCLEDIPAKTPPSWLSIWTGLEKTFRQCRATLSAVPGATLSTEILPRQQRGRFKDSPALRHLEAKWTQPTDFEGGAPGESLRAVVCGTPASEAVLAAREILRFVRAGGRFREIAVLLRAMEAHQDSLRRVFSRYEIPFFMDRREKVAQHPLAELTRSVLRAAAFGWRHDDWFGALKTGLVAPEEEDIDRLENEALLRGWTGEAWFAPLPTDNLKSDWPERLRRKWIGPFAKFRGVIRPNGPELAQAMRQLWLDLNVEKTLEDWSGAEGKDGAVHGTVWRQMQAWLDDLALAFDTEAMPLRDWLPILEAGLAELSVGVIPPALDQVLIGTIDRSRNPDLKLVILLGVNETVFPATPPEGSLLNESDREELGRHEIRLGHSRREFLSRERFFGYIACTRSRQRLVVACAERNNDGQPLNPSPFFSHLRSLFSNLQVEKFSGPDWTRAEHLCELSGQLARAGRRGPLLTELLSRPAFAALRERIATAPASAQDERLAPEITAQLYGPALQTSVSRLEEFAACSFKFFVHSGLRAEERKRFELDARERGSFQHEALAIFHRQLRDQNKNWRDITPAEARQRIKDCVSQLLPQFHEGLLAASGKSRFAARVVGETLQDFVAATVEWMAHYQFDPRESELGFGFDDGKLPAWNLDLGQGRRLILRGKIDRVDLRREGGDEEALAVVIDYKSGALKLEDILMENGLQLQLAAYLALLRRLDDARKHFGVGRIVPAGVFYVNLRGQTESGKNRTSVLETREQFRQKRHQHLGRFDGAALPFLDSRGASEGAQFKFRLKKDGAPHGSNTDLLRTEDFRRLLDHVEAELVRMGREIYDGVIAPNPYQKGDKVACDNCDYKSICRFDPWTQPYRVLRAARREAVEAEE